MNTLSSSAVTPFPRKLATPLRVLLVSGLLALGACGSGTAENNSGALSPGGGSGGGATASVQPLANSPEQARTLVSASLATDGAAVTADKRFDKLNQNGLSSVTASGRPGASLAATVAGKSLAGAQSKATQNLDCSEIYQIGSTVGPGETVTACSGSLTINTSDDAQGSESTILPAGAFYNFSFNNISITTTGSGTVQINGQMNTTVLEALTLTGGQLFGKLRIGVVNLSGFSNGEFVAPESFTMDITYAGSSIAYAIDGQQFANLNVDIVDDNNFTIVAGDFQAPVDNGVVNVSFSDWQVVNGIPQTGARVTATGAGNTTASLEVISTTANSATFEVTITADGSTETRIVIATLINGQVIVQ